MGHKPRSLRLVPLLLVALVASAGFAPATGITIGPYTLPDLSGLNVGIDNITDAAGDGLAFLRKLNVNITSVLNTITQESDTAATIVYGYVKNFFNISDDANRYKDQFVIAIKDIVNYTQTNVNSSAILGLGPLISLPQEVFNATKHGLRNVIPQNVTYIQDLLPGGRKLLQASIPRKWNWIEKGVMTPAKDQGECGGCWTFATTAAVEATNAIKSGYTQLYSLSEQQILDCGSQEASGGNGCNGNTIEQGLVYVRRNGGLTSEAAYPYEGTSSSCNTQLQGWKVNSVNSIGYVQPGSVNALAAAVSQIGPVMVGISGSTRQLQYYRAGVLDDFAECCPSGADCTGDLDHAVVVVGYDMDKKYWIVRNSWGPSWGYDGYFLLSMETPPGYTNGMCGILSMPTVAQVSTFQGPQGQPPSGAPPLENLLSGGGSGIINPPGSTSPPPGKSSAASVHAGASAVIMAALASALAVLMM